MTVQQPIEQDSHFLLTFFSRPDVLRYIRNAALVFVIGCGLLLAVLSLTFTLLAWPVADDVCRATLGGTVQDAIHFVTHKYTTWTGRWAVMASYALLMPRIGVSGFGYTLALLFVQMVWASAFYVVAAFGLGRGINRRVALVVAIIMTLVFWSGMPGPEEGWYWLTGALEYNFPFLLIVIGSCALVRAVESPRPVRLLVLAGVAGFLATGFNELLGLIFIVLAVAWACGLWLFGGRRHIGGALLVILFVGIGEAISWGAPGNAVRSAQTFPNGSSLFVLGKSLVHFDESPLAWLVDPRLLLASLIALCTPQLRLITRGLSPKVVQWLPLAAIVICGAMMMAYLGAYFVHGYMPPLRIRDVLYGIYLIAWLLGLLAIVAKLDLGWASEKTILISQSIAFVLFGVSLLTSHNTTNAIVDLPYTIKSWRPKMQNWFDYQSGHKEKIILVDQKLRHPKLYMRTDFRSDQKYWLDNCYRVYLNKKFVIKK